MRSDAVADLVDRAARYLDAAPPGPGDPTANPRGDHDLDGIEVVPPGPHRRAAVLVPGIFAVECKSYLFVLHQGESRLTIVAVPGSCASNAVKTAARRDVYTNFYTLCIYRLSICLMKCDIIYLLFCLSDIPKCYEICFAFLDGTV